MASTITVRNLSPVDLKINCIERFEGPKDQSPNPLAAILQLLLNQKPAGPIVAPDASPQSHDDVSVPVSKFSAVVLNQSIPQMMDTVRLVIEAEGQQYKVDFPGPSDHSMSLIPMVSGAKYDFSAVYVPNDGFLAIFLNPKLSDWMSNIKDHLALSVLSIPGTHNSPTFHFALPSVRCQAVSPREQLENGVRFFDIRLMPEKPDDPSNDGLVLVHGVFPISLTGNKYFRDVVNDVESFLAAHPRETVIISIKREGPGETKDEQVAQILRQHYATDSNKWFTEPRVPRIGEVRGKIVVLRRFNLDDEGRKGHSGQGWGINAENWRYNTENDQSGDVIVQDFCEVLETDVINKKIEVCCAHLGRSGAIKYDLQAVPPFYLNFLSASNFWRIGCWPDRIAAKLNPAVLGHICVKHVIENEGADWSTGIVVCDYVGYGGDWDLVKSIVAMNSKLLLDNFQMIF